MSFPDQHGYSAQPGKEGDGAHTTTSNASQFPCLALPCTLTHWFSGPSHTTCHALRMSTSIRLIRPEKSAEPFLAVTHARILGSNGTFFFPSSRLFLGETKWRRWSSKRLFSRACQLVSVNWSFLKHERLSSGRFPEASVSSSPSFRPPSLESQLLRALLVRWLVTAVGALSLVQAASLHRLSGDGIRDPDPSSLGAQLPAPLCSVDSSHVYPW